MQSKNPENVSEFLHFNFPHLGELDIFMHEINFGHFHALSYDVKHISGSSGHRNSSSRSHHVRRVFLDVTFMYFWGFFIYFSEDLTLCCGVFPAIVITFHPVRSASPVPNHPSSSSSSS